MPKSINSKKFQGQGKNEKILFFSREHWFSFVSTHYIEIFISVVGIPLFTSGFFYFFLGNRSALISLCISTVGVLSFFIHYYYDTFYAITNIRMIKHVREGIFSHHIKEINIKNIDEIFYTSRGIRSKVRRYGTVNAGSRTDMLIVYFRGVKHGKQLALYLSKIRDLIREKPEIPAEKIHSFVLRRKRYNKGNIVKD